MAQNNLRPGQKMEDGSLYAGTLKDGRQVFTTPTDLKITVTFNEAVSAIDKMNAEKALGHDDWHMPSKEELKVLLKGRHKGELKGSFKTAAKAKHSRYHWSSTPWVESEGTSVYTYRFTPLRSWSWFDKEAKLSARPVRVAAPAP